LPGRVVLTGHLRWLLRSGPDLILLACVTAFLPGDIQRANAYNNALAGTADFAAAIVFGFATRVAWPVALTIAVGAILGSRLGGVVGRHLTPELFRVLIVKIGSAAVIYFVIKQRAAREPGRRFPAIRSWTRRCRGERPAAGQLAKVSDILVISSSVVMTCPTR
jgi:uncharacterized membrane protein YfcA